MPLWRLAALAVLCARQVSASAYAIVAGPNLTSATSLGLPGSTARAAAVAAFTAQAFGLNPANVTISCALINMGYSAKNDIWDGYAGFAHPMGEALTAALATVQPASMLRLQAGDVEGVLVRVLRELQAAIGFNIQWSLVTPPVSLLPPNSNSTDPMLMYAFKAFNQTCVLQQTSLSPSRLLYMRQSVPVLSFGYQTVTTRAIIPKLSTLDRVFYWTRPFSTGVWYLLAASTITFASFMFLFERRSGFAEGSHSNGEVAGHALFKSFTALAVFVPFEPETAGGRIAAGVHSFSLLLIIASYTANLAASYTTADSPVQLIHSVSDFGPLLPACVRASSTLATFLNTTYPSAASAVTDQTTFGLNSYGSAEALRGVLSGKCVGAVIPFYEASFVMNANDTQGEFCNLVPVGPTVGEEVVSFTFAPEGAHPQSLTAAQLEAFNLQLASLHQTGDFLIQTEATYFPPPPRPVCAPQDAADAAALAVLAPAAAIQPIDLAGAFGLQAIGLLLGGLFHVSKALRQNCARAFSRLMESKPAAGQIPPTAVSKALAPKGCPQEETAPPRPFRAPPNGGVYKPPKVNPNRPGPFLFESV